MYKALRGTVMYYIFEDRLIPGNVVMQIAGQKYYSDNGYMYKFDTRQDVYEQVTPVTAEDIAKAFSSEPEFDNELFSELLSLANISVSDYEDKNGELDRDRLMADVAKTLDVVLE